MATKKLEEYTTEELSKKAQTLKTVLGIMIGLIGVYIVFFIYLLVADKWTITNTFGVTMMAMLGTVSATTIASLRKIQQEIKKRQA
ncbi:MAG: hypothetical protein OHK0039_37490 [Bacteroidia bacterium]